jgi:hypothetical protein
MGRTTQSIVESHATDEAIAPVTPPRRQTTGRNHRHLDHCRDRHLPPASWKNSIWVCIGSSSQVMAGAVDGRERWRQLVSVIPMDCVRQVARHSSSVDHHNPLLSSGPVVAG